MARRIDTPDSLAAGLLKAAAEAFPVARAVVGKGALNVKSQARRNVQQSAPVSNAHAHNAITYDISPTRSLTGIEAEIGYDKDLRGGGLGNLLEFGGGKDHSPPHRDLGRALDDEEPRFEDAIAKAIEKLL